MECLLEYLKCLMEPYLSPFVIASGPQEANGHHTLPFDQAILRCASGVERALVITIGPLKIAEGFIGLSPFQVERCRWHLREVVSCFYSTGEVVDSCLLGVERECFCSRLLCIDQGLLPHTRCIGLRGQFFQVSLASGWGRATKPLQGFDDGTMHSLAFSKQQRGCDSFLGEGVSKGKLVSRLFYHQLGSYQLFEQG